MHNAIDLIKTDHRILRELLTMLEKTGPGSPKRRIGLLHEIESELTVHTALEEEIFYPALRELGGIMNDVVYCTALEQHHSALDDLLPSLAKMNIVSPDFSQQVRALKDVMITHIEYEENEILPLTRQRLSLDNLNLLGIRLKERRSELITPPVENE